ncbi:GTPase [Sphaerisporangium sp. TRM90804]|uniref:GTPase n=1 Tax=Sphaerisporangium sp. TRM90804 TaxID=3031113 RepID=UPI002447605F|nr:GTPase [Sphaerisporangium sp. TRM90804]MDH2429019.1 50S ribosome-binding GTPase [Sphaerisporangium sp. TRM90804]
MADEDDAVTLLQAEVRDRLTDLDALLTQAGELDLHAVRSGRGVEAAMSAVHDDVEAIERMELRIPIVAPMSAGKSTIINAMTGLTLLPARVTGMTTLPTRIVLDDVAEPVLRLAASDAALFDTLTGELATRLGDAERDDVLDLFPHMGPLLDLIVSGPRVPFPLECTGEREIQRTLMRLNELVRVGSVVLPDVDVVSALSDVPSLHTPSEFAPAGAGPGAGTLVLVDTPGPDDAQMSVPLTEIVADQLAKAHVVVIVLDYTRLNVMADEAIRELVRPVLARIGTEKLFAVVNKVDERLTEEDPGPEEVVRLVGRLLGFSGDQARERVIETRARFGLAAARVLARVTDAGDGLDPATDPAVEAMLRLRSRYGWERDRETATVASLHATAQEMWRYSGLPVFRDRVLHTLRRTAVPILVDAVLGRTIGMLDEIEAAASNRIAAMHADQAEITRRMDDLAGELAELDRLTSRLPGKNEVRKRAQDSVAEVIDGARRRGEVVIDSVRGAKRFDTAKEAKKYIKKRRNKASEELDYILYDARNEVARRLGLLRGELLAQAEKSVAPIMRRAGVAAGLPAPEAVSLTPSSAKAVKGGGADPDRKTKTYVAGHERVDETLGEMFVRWWQGEAAPTTPVYGQTVSYKAGLGDTRHTLAASFGARVDDLSAQVREHVAPQLAAHVSRYHDDAVRLVKAYRDDLAAARDDLRTDDRRRRVRLEELAELVEATRSASAELRELQERAAS